MNETAIDLLKEIVDAFDTDSENGVHWLNNIWWQDVQKAMPRTCAAIGKGRNYIYDSDSE